MKIHDISMNINEEMVVYRNNEDKKPKYHVRSNYTTGNHYETSITLDMHAGTHIDAPLHMVKDGQMMDFYNLQDFITDCKVIDLTHLENKITKKDLENKNINKNDFILFKTKNSFDTIWNDHFVYLDQSGADYLVKKQIKGVGTDGLGIERNQPGHETHISLLSNGIIIIEGLRLKAIHEGEYILNALPLKIDQVEAAPTRAILIEK